MMITLIEQVELVEMKMRSMIKMVSIHLSYLLWKTLLAYQWILTEMVILITVQTFDH